MPKEMHDLNPGVFITAAYYPDIFCTKCHWAEPTFWSRILLSQFFLIFNFLTTWFILPYSGLALKLSFLALIFCLPVSFIALLTLVKQCSLPLSDMGKTLGLASDYQIVLKVKIQQHSGLVPLLLGEFALLLEVKIKWFMKTNQVCIILLVCEKSYISHYVSQRSVRMLITLSINLMFHFKPFFTSNLKAE